MKDATPDTSTPPPAAEAPATPESFAGSALVPDDELAAALAEIGDAPSLDAETDAPTAKTPTAADDVSGALAEIAAAEAEDEPAAQSGGRKLRFQVGKKPPLAIAADDAAPGGDELGTGAAGGGRLSAPRVSPFKRVYRALDAGLEWMARPLASAPEPIRRVIGRAALAWITLATLVTIVAPFIVRGRDAISFLDDKVEALRAERANDVEETPEAPKSDAAP